MAPCFLSLPCSGRAVKSSYNYLYSRTFLVYLPLNPLNNCHFFLKKPKSHFKLKRYWIWDILAKLQLSFLTSASSWGSDFQNSVLQLSEPDNCPVPSLSSKYHSESALQEGPLKSNLFKQRTWPQERTQSLSHPPRVVASYSFNVNQRQARR